MPDPSVPGIRNGHQTPPGVEVDNLDIIIVVGTEGGEGVPDPRVSGIRHEHQTPAGYQPGQSWHHRQD